MAEIVTWTERDVATLERIQERVLWLATYMVHHANHLRPNGDGLKVGGHQASSASLVTVMTALYGAFLRPGDRVAVKPHASPVFHAIQYLRGRLPEDALRRFRAYQGLQAYPSRTKDVDEVDYSTGSVGLGAVAAAFGGLTRQYLHDHFGLDGEPRFIALVGDAELDEGNVWEAVAEEHITSSRPLRPRWSGSCWTRSSGSAARVPASASTCVCPPFRSTSDSFRRAGRD
jgi:pyruvate dehydrogenase E1 component